MSKKLLIISGLDPSGGAGLLCDLEIAHTFPIKTSAVVTALTSQNKNKFFKTQVVSGLVFQNQLRAIEPLSQYQAIKIGMLGDEKIVKTLVSSLREARRATKQSRNFPKIILDPIIRSSTGGTLLSKSGCKLLFDHLIPLVDLWTPNLDEAFYYCKIPSTPPLAKGGKGDLEKMAKFLWSQKKVPIFIKGGHAKTGKKVTDFFVDENHQSWFVFPRLVRAIHELPLRGTGCTLSTLIASFVAIGFPLFEAMKQARCVMQKWLQSQA